MQDRRWWMTAAGSGALTVMAGAFGAHALGDTLAPKLLAAFETGVRYQAWHTLAILGVLAWRSSLPRPGQLTVIRLWALGILLFSGSLYALALSGVTLLGLITPFGGFLLILGWLTLGVSAWRA
ncbi:MULTISPECIES: DUF423 domain-containing protein [Halomonadaceae]|uniref:DUF423 domain-containing protein n=1 Tax=Halomonadaceae TaxID=28256 RepID=UPI001581B616|nr:MULTISPECIES: DUF423 domain-containing protein [Halomonas]MDI4636589.1 DUF423 domain-containing protein [Halomonas sp. BMC7]NUJ60954.1 DUF423 domain-containing protein [Halomonas taeanensis]